MTSEPSFGIVDRNVQHILEILSHTDERQIISLLIRGDLSRPDNFRSRLRVESPAKMRSYLLALLMQAQVTLPLNRLNDEQVEDLFRRLYEIELHYRFDILRKVSTEPSPQQIAALSIVLSWFFSVELVSVENIREISQMLFSACDNIGGFDNTLGIKSLDALEMIEFICGQLNSQVNSLSNLYAPYLELRDTLCDERLDIRLTDSLSISLAELEFSFGQPLCSSFMKAFAVERGLERTYLYPATNERAHNPVEVRPLILSSGRIFLTSRNALHLSLYRRCLNAIRNSNEALTLRKEFTEVKVAGVFKRIFPAAEIVSSACEDRNGQYEHDLVVLEGDTLLVVEVKGGGPIPPRLEVDEAIAQILHRSKPGLKSSKTSPFHAIFQAQRLLQVVHSATSPVSLYNSNDGSPCITIDPFRVSNVFAIAVTLENYGPVTTNWDLLNFIDKTIGFPWAITIADLDAFADALLYLGLDGSSLIQFLTERIDCHGKLLTFDELDFAEVFLRDGSLSAISTAKEPINPDNLRWGLFDEIEATRRSARAD